MKKYLICALLVSGCQMADVDGQLTDAQFDGLVQVLRPVIRPVQEAE